MAHSDAADSLYQHVKARILQKNSQRVVAGLLVAQDWPPQNVKMDAFYMLDLEEIPVGVQSGSIGNPVTTHAVIWKWVTIGSDLKQGVRMANRGDRFRTWNAMKGELTYALYPNFTEKLTWALDGNGKWTGSHLDPVEYVKWSRPRYGPKLEMGSGKIEESVLIYMTDMLEQITA